MNITELQKAGEKVKQSVLDINQACIENVKKNVQEMFKTELEECGTIIERVGITEISRVLKKEDAVVVGIYNKLEGDIVGCLMIIMHEETKDFLIKHFEEETGRVLEEDYAIKRMGIVVTEAYLEAFLKCIDVDVKRKETAYNRDMVAALVSTSVAEYSIKSDNLLLLRTAYRDAIRKDDNSMINVVFLPYVESLDKVISFIEKRLENI